MAKKAAKSKSPKPTTPAVLTPKVNVLGKSESYDKAIQASATLVSHFYHVTLKKYVTEDGNIVESLTIPGQGEGEEPLTVSAVDSLTFDLQKLTNLALMVNNLQRLRQDAALDISLNPLNG